MYTNNPKPIGEEVEIKYNPEDPSEIIWVDYNTDFIFQLIGGIFAMVGLVLAIIGITNINKKRVIE